MNTIHAKDSFGETLSTIAIGYIVVMCLGGMLTTPTGPGSYQIVFIVLSAYSLLVMIFGSPMSKRIGLIALLLSLFGTGCSYYNRFTFEHHVHERYVESPPSRRLE